MFYPLRDSDYTEIDMEFAVNNAFLIELELFGGDGAVTPVAAAIAEGTVKLWLVDTGAGNHFVGRKYLSQ